MNRNNIIYIGGVHGVGKDTVCDILEKELGYEHLSCSKILRWNNYSNDIKNKRVENIQITQKSFINNIDSFIKDNKTYLLDGHFALLSTSNIIEEIPMYVYEKINPLIIFLLTLDPKTIVLRLNKRDSKIYNADLIKEFQDKERNNASFVAKKLGLRVIEIDNANIDKSVLLMKEMINNTVFK